MLAGLAALFAAAAVHFQGDAAVCTVAGSGPHGAAVVCLDWRGYYTMWVTLVSLVLMARDAPPDLVLSGATLSLLLLRVITDAEALRGFASPSIATVGVLFVLAKALEQTGAVDALVVPALGAPRSHTAAVLRVCVPTALLSALLRPTASPARLPHCLSHTHRPHCLSRTHGHTRRSSSTLAPLRRRPLAQAFLNNTPIVAMLIPACESLARRHNLSARVRDRPRSTEAAREIGRDRSRSPELGEGALRMPRLLGADARRHLGGISAASRRHLSGISAASRRHLSGISAPVVSAA